MTINDERLIEIIAEEVRRISNEGQSSVQQPVQAPAYVEKPVLPQTHAEVTPHAVPCTDRTIACKQADKNRLDTLRCMQVSTVARIGIGRCGARMPTAAQLDFREDHAAAKDAVIQNVDKNFLEKMGLFSVQTRCRDKNEYLTRPDLGRLLCPEAEKVLKEKCKQSPKVQIFAAGGLSSMAMQANLDKILPVLTDSLGAMGISIGTPFYVRFGRVGVEDAISELLDAEMVCMLVGERPGLVSAESMSAYIAYRATKNMPESRRTVVSNIHRGGTAAAEAGAYVADIIEQILKEKKSGVELKR